MSSYLIVALRYLTFQLAKSRSALAQQMHMVIVQLLYCPYDIILINLALLKAF